MSIIEHLYDEIHGPKLTPYELLENVKLPNYISVDFKTENDFIIGISKCKIDKDEIATFTYFFNKENKLVRLTSNVNGENSEIYNREKAIKEYYALAKKTLFSDKAAV
ncbi:hypothetical protein BN2127_JRS7_00505 [Bacillus subtilis]|uniref:hypothetical protein n=1 Tax=Bacillus spizizenii TaxID=96241 RepID=UPI0006A91E6C|nr:hypothetical protein [Bacillus spizizenii]OWV37551.1 hypothetical protein CE489_08740 [Bacillus spizizenii]CUB34887.1 hypothetical protein BN2127_JRS7_00505 [Bacillus subtilis]